MSIEHRTDKLMSWLPMNNNDYEITENVFKNWFSIQMRLTNYYFSWHAFATLNGNYWKKKKKKTIEKLFPIIIIWKKRVWLYVRVRIKCGIAQYNTYYARWTCYSWKKEIEWEVKNEREKKEWNYDVHFSILAIYINFYWSINIILNSY